MYNLGLGFIFLFVAGIVVLRGDENDFLTNHSASEDDNILFWDCRNRHIKDEKRNANIQFFGASRYGKCYELDPGNGSFHFNLDENQLKQLGENWLIELVILPAQKNGNIFSFNNLNLIQKEKSFVLSDWSSKNSTIIKVAALTEPLHLLVNVSNSWIKIFQNGKLTDQVDSSSWNLNSNVQIAKVVVGGGWHGKIYYISIGPSVKKFGSALKRAKSHWQFDTLPDKKLKLIGKLIEVTQVPKIKQISPYQRAITYNHYELEERFQKIIGTRNIAVAHWCILDNKYVADLPNEAGLNYQLMVEPILDNPQIKRERHFNDLSRFDLKLFYDVSLPKVK